MIEAAKLALDDPQGWMPIAQALLADGVARRGSAWRVMTLASLSADGWPEVRSVTLRHFDAQAWELGFNLDRRSPKWAQMAAHDQICLHGYDAAGRMQLRLWGHVRLHGDDALGDAAWMASQPMSRACYAVAQAPGAELPSPPLAPAKPDGQDEQARAHFGAARVELNRVDMLWLRAEGHVRVGAYLEDGAMQARWLSV
jgi:pyridoxamine 5'-phosphate oxidase